MANGNELKVIIGADGKPLEKTLEQLKADLKQFNKELGKSGDAKSIADLNRKLKETQANIKSIKNFEGINNGLSSIKPNANAAGAAMISLNRVVQDAPFGFIAIQNNLTELPQAFKSLVASTGSTAGALRALGSSMLGAGGIGFALSAVTSLVTVSIQKYGSLGNALQSLLGKLDANVVAQQKFRDAQIESNKNAGEELAKLNLLVSASQDQTRTLTERKSAVVQLQKEFKDYFGSLTQEAILNGRVADATIRARDAILSRAKATAVQERLSQVESELLNIGLKREEVTQRYSKAQEKVNKALEAQNKAGIKAQDIFIQGSGVLSPLVLAKGDLRSIVGDLESLAKAEGDFLKERNFLISQFEKNDFSVKPLIGETGTSKAKEQKTALEQQIERLEKVKSATGLLFVEEKKLADLRSQQYKVEAIKLGVDPGAIKRSVNAILAPFDGEFSDAFRAKFENITIRLNTLPKVDIASVAGTLGAQLPADFAAPITEALRRSGEAGKQAYLSGLQEQFGQKIGEIVAGGAIDAFAQIGASIGDILSGNGGIASAAQAFLGIIGGVLQDVGKQIILTSTLIESLKKALASAFANPGALLAVGAGLVAVGALLKNIKFDVPKFAEGGLVTGPTLGLVGEAGPELIVPLNRADQFFGGGNNVNVSGELVARGSDLVLIYDRALEQRRRRGG